MEILQRAVLTFLNILGSELFPLLALDEELGFS